MTDSTPPDDASTGSDPMFGEVDADGDPTVQRPKIPPSMPKQIGKYRLKDVIASGGMGTVYLAIQETPRRRVALKVMKQGVASKSALRRFEFESQILGRLRHPNIAQVYDAGTHDDGEGGVPYFAMEYIPGAKTLTEYATHKKLGTRERLELFTKVCDAVHHGHQKGIIHRDLKPSNILVDSSGEPKIIDFGVARATDSDMAVTTLQTDIGQLIGTLQYMSPEQCDADPDDLDTRSDVYALGVVLYELLCGQLPYDVSRAAVYEAARVIRESQPAKPSTIDRMLRGDVETITLKAMEKDRDRRYQSAADLGQDIGRYLVNEPITARRPSVSYRMRRFASRNRAAVIAASFIAVLLVIGTIVSSAGWQRAVERQREAEAQAFTARESLIEIVKQGLRNRDEDEVAAQVAGAGLEMSLKDGEDGLLFYVDIPEGEEVSQLAAFAEQLFVWMEEAREESEGARVEATQRAAELEQITEFQAKQLSGIDVPMMAARIRADVIVKSQWAWRQSDVDEGEVLARSDQLKELLAETNFTDVALTTLDENIFNTALDVIDEDYADQPLIQARLFQSVARTLRAIGLLQRAEAPHIQALTIRRRVLGDEHTDTLTSMDNMGALLRDQGRLEEAEQYCREALSTRRRMLGNEHPDTLTSINNMGVLLELHGRLSEAEAYYLEALEVSRSARGDEQHKTATLINNMGNVLRAQGRLAEAEPYYREAVEIGRRIFGDDHPNTLVSIGNFGGVLRAQGKLSEAEPYYREALEKMRRVLGDEHSNTLVFVGNLGSLLRAQGRWSEAESYFTEAMQTQRRVLGDEHPDTVISISNLAGVLQAQGKLETAESLAAEAVDRGRSAFGPEHPFIGLLLGEHAVSLGAMKRFAEAESSMLESHSMLAAGMGDSDVRTKRAIERLAELYDAWHEAEPEAGYDAKAAEWRAKLEHANDADPSGGD